MLQLKCFAQGLDGDPHGISLCFNFLLESTDMKLLINALSITCTAYAAIALLMSGVGWIMLGNGIHPGISFPIAVVLVGVCFHLADCIRDAYFG